MTCRDWSYENCPQCGHPVTSSYLKVNGCCVYCQTGMPPPSLDRLKPKPRPFFSESPLIYSIGPFDESGRGDLVIHTEAKAETSGTIALTVDGRPIRPLYQTCKDCGAERVATAFWEMSGGLCAGCHEKRTKQYPELICPNCRKPKPDKDFPQNDTWCIDCCINRSVYGTAKTAFQRSIEKEAFGKDMEGEVPCRQCGTMTNPDYIKSATLCINCLNALRDEYPMTEHYSSPGRAGDCGTAGSAGQAGDCFGYLNVPCPEPKGDLSRDGMPPPGSGRHLLHEANIFLEQLPDGTKKVRFCRRGNNMVVPEKFFAPFATLQGGPKISNYDFRMWGVKTD